MTQNTTITKKQYEEIMIEEVLTIASILIKLGFDHIVEDQNLFVEFLNELGLRTHIGTRLTRPSLNLIATRLKSAKALVETFTNEFKNYYIVADLMIKDSTARMM